MRCHADPAKRIRTLGFSVSKYTAKRLGLRPRGGTQSADRHHGGQVYAHGAARRSSRGRREILCNMGCCDDGTHVKGILFI